MKGAGQTATNELMAYLQAIHSKDASLHNPPASKLDTLPEHLNIAPQPIGTLEELGKRLLTPTNESRVFKVLIDKPLSHYEDFWHFYFHALKNQERQVRVYGVQGHAIKIIVPEDYAQKLDKLRNLRLSSSSADIPPLLQSVASSALCSHPFSHRLLPEELIPYLDELPTRLIKEIVLLDTQRPEDVWFGVVAPSKAESGGCITFFRPARDSNIRDILGHEWAHLLHFDQPQWLKPFRAALELEGKGLSAHYCALSDECEHFAVFYGEELLNLSGPRFFRAAHEAPLRSAIWAQAMAQALHSVAPGQRSHYHEEFLKRVQYIKDVILPVARTILSQYLQQDCHAQAMATILLRCLP